MQKYKKIGLEEELSGKKLFPGITSQTIASMI
jgi:hypothetical protein